MATDSATKTRVKLAKTQHDTHVNLLMMNEGLSKPDAIVMAYLDGFAGFAARLQKASEPGGKFVPPAK